MQDKNFSQTFITFHKSKQNPPTLHLNTLISNFKKIPFFFSHSKNKQNKTPSSTTSSKGYTTKRYTTLQQPFSWVLNKNPPRGQRSKVDALEEFVNVDDVCGTGFDDVFNDLW